MFRDTLLSLRWSLTTFNYIIISVYAIRVKVYSVLMPYPSKIDGHVILSAAMKELAAEGIRELSLRSVAASLNVAPNAIYRYFPDRSVLEAAVADETARQLELALRRSVKRCDAITALRRMAAAYMKFARDNPHFYEVMMGRHSPIHGAACRESVWLFTVSQVQRVAGEDRAEDASVALWAFLHGAAVLEKGPVFANDVTRGFHFGLDAWIRAIANPDRTEPSASVQSTSSFGS